MVEVLRRHASEQLGRLTDRLAQDCGQEETLQVLVEDMITFIQGRNQFLVIGAKERDGLKAVYERLLSGFRSTMKPSRPSLKRIEKALAFCQADLEAFAAGLAASNEGPAFVENEPISSGYSPDLQLSLLSTHADDLIEPILDLGCGERGDLVHYLRRRGKEAFGVDRAIRGNRYFIHADWLDHPLGSGAWGTVISHMALSNHFLHHHLRKGGHPERYAKRYMEVLQSLRPAGSFVYAPGLPFIEDLLPRDDYLVERFPAPALSGGMVDAALKERHGTSILYACHVTRISH